MKVRPKKTIGRPSKSRGVRKQQHHIENVIRQMVDTYSNDNNRELVDRNASLLAEVETLKREKLQIFESLMYRQNNQHKHQPNTIRSELMVLSESLKKDHKNMIQMFETTFEFYNQMISKICDKIGECVQNDSNLGSNEVEVESSTTESQVNGSEERVSKSQTIFETRRLSRQSGQQMVPNVESDGQLSVIEEISQEVANNEKPSTNTTQNMSNDSRPQSPIRAEFCNSGMDYALTPHLDNQTMRTPSIYNFNSNLINTFRMTGFDGSFLSMSDTSLKPEISLTDFNSFESTLTDEQKGLTSSTPVNSNRLSCADLNHQRPSRRISSINRPYSPRIGRPSLMDIQNVLENKNNNRKKSCVSTISDSKTKTILNNETNDTNCVNKTKKRRKDSSKSQTSNESSADLSDSSNLSMRSSRRQRKPVSYKEPSLNCKLRRNNH